MTTGMIILASFFGLAALLTLTLVVLILIYGKPKTEAARIDAKKDLATRLHVSPEKRAWLHSKDNPANKVFPHNLL